ncbi:MAG TPA: hypothetical protein PLJ35_21575 [Anaerolineae bacterium]|nr:hypothetical protein [Anaerolineae bacterium]HOR01411.1 hypothetical protein [Anaerolineae bacterium]HPL28442.1 hypothetical protein [Anaerolineae bacterium]
MERGVWTMLGTTLLLASLGPRAGRRLQRAGLATAGCGLGLLVIALAMAGFGAGLLLAGGLLGPDSALSRGSSHAAGRGRARLPSAAD